MPFVYRLQLLLEQREAALEEAQRNLGAMIAGLEEAKRTLGALEQAASVAVKVHAEAANSFGAVAQEPMTGAQMMERVERVRGLLREANLAKDEVLEQKIAVQDAEDLVEESRTKLADAMRAVEVLRKHRSRAQEKYRRGEEQREAGEMDEAGMVQFNRGRNA